MQLFYALAINSLLLLAISSRAGELEFIELFNKEDAMELQKKIDRATPANPKKAHFLHASGIYLAHDAIA